MKCFLFLGIIIIILFFPFYINIEIVKNKKENAAKIGVGIFNNKLKIFYKIDTNKVDKIKKKSKIKHESNFSTFLIKKINSFFKKKKKKKSLVFIKSLLNNLSFKLLIFETKFGFNDAAQTAIVAGIMYTINSFLLVYLENKVKVNNVRLRISPVFSSIDTEVNFNCIIKYKLVYIITAGMNCLKERKKVVD